MMTDGRGCKHGLLVSSKGYLLSSLAEQSLSCNRRHFVGASRTQRVRNGAETVEAKQVEVWWRTT